MIVSNHVAFKSRNKYGHVLIDSLEALHPGLIRLNGYSLPDYVMAAPAGLQLVAQFANMVYCGRVSSG